MTDEVVTPAPAPAPTPTPEPAPVAPVAPVVVAPPAEDVEALKARLAALEAKANRPCATIRAFNASICAVLTTGRVAACGLRVLNGFKTVLFFGVSGALALASEFDAIDLTPFISYVLPEGTHVSVAQAVTIMSVAGIALRIVTKTPAFKRWARPSQSSGSVDEPKN
jgi:hypothetical protein